MRGPESVKEMEEGNPPADGGQVGHSAQVHDFLGLALHSMAYPVERQDITSLWSPKIDSAWVASARAETWVTPGSRLPAILYIFGIISKRPWEAVNVVVSAPAVREPWTAPAAPPPTA